MSLNTYIKIAFGGGCHWCTEAVFQSLKGVHKVEQGFVASIQDNAYFSEAVIVHFNPEVIDLEILIKVHLHTHKSTSNHSMRKRYRSAIYTYDDTQGQFVSSILREIQKDFKNRIITKVLPFSSFRPSAEQFQNYYAKNPEKPFCERYIAPKLDFLLKEYRTYL